MNRASLFYPFLDTERIHQCSGLIGDENVKIVGIIGKSPPGMHSKGCFGKFRL